MSVGALCVLRDVSALYGYQAATEALGEAFRRTGAADGATVTMLACGIAEGRRIVTYDEMVDMSGHDGLMHAREVV